MIFISLYDTPNQNIMKKIFTYLYSDYPSMIFIIMTVISSIF